ncbi:MAG: NADH-quinone oxidoreductase subunit C, partial [Mesorhizobium sp.]
LGEKLSGRIGDAVFAYGELTISVEPHDLIEVITFLRDDKNCQFISIIDVCGADYPSRAKRFDVVYHLLSPKQNVRIRLKVQADEETV